MFAGRTRDGDVNPPCRARRWDGALFLKELFDASYVFGCIDADGVVFYLGDTNLPAIFQPTELFELLDFFELTLGKSRVFEQGIALENV